MQKYALIVTNFDNYSAVREYADNIDQAKEIWNTYARKERIDTVGFEGWDRSGNHWEFVNIKTGKTIK
jgi:hypothetical protein